MFFSPRFIALVISILAINNVLILTPFTPMPVYFGVFLLTFVLAIINSRPSFDFTTFIFVLICFFSIQLNDIPDLFKPAERMAAFSIALLVISPFMNGKYINAVKSNCFKITNRLIIGITVLSFIGKITGIYAGLDFASHFGGLTLSSMSLAPLAGISLLVSVFYLKFAKLSKKYKWFYMAIILMSFLVLIMAASRIAIVSAVVAILYLFTRFYRNRYSKFVRVLFVLSIIMAITYPFWEGYTENLVEKYDERIEEGNVLSSREDLWVYRLEEFNQSPVIGIGFSNSMYGTINYDTGTVEPGTSWGVILAMTGILGLLSFIILVIRAFRKNSVSNSKTYLSVGHILNALLIFFMFHWIAEGYILAAGSYLFFYSWLLLGVSSGNKRNHKIKIL